MWGMIEKPVQLPFCLKVGTLMEALIFEPELEIEQDEKLDHTGQAREAIAGTLENN